MIYSKKCTTSDQLFLRKIIKIDVTRCLNFSAKCTKMRLAAVLCPDPLTALPQTLQLDSRGPTSKGREGECAQFCIQIWRIKSPDLGLPTALRCDNSWHRHRIRVLTFSKLIAGGDTDVCPGRQIPSRRHCTEKPTERNAISMSFSVPASAKLWIVPWSSAIKYLESSYTSSSACLFAVATLHCLAC